MNWRLVDTIDTSLTDSILYRSSYLYGARLTSCTAIGVMMLQKRTFAEQDLSYHDHDPERAYLTHGTEVME